MQNDYTLIRLSEFQQQCLDKKTKYLLLFFHRGYIVRDMCYGIVGAQEIEISLLKVHMTKIGPVTRRGGLDFYKGQLSGADVVLVRSGVGKVNAALCAQELIVSFGVTALINLGVAGAIDGRLSPMDLVLSADLVYHDVDVTVFGYPPTEIPGMASSIFIADKFLVAAAERAAKSIGARYWTGRIATGDCFIASTEGKERIAALCQPLAVEMEGAGVGHAAQLWGVPFVVLRCISDRADEEGTTAYRFNEKDGADQSARLVLRMLDLR
jgi:adenosylhomocysteine nucleosidase